MSVHENKCFCMRIVYIVHIEYVYVTDIYIFECNRQIVDKIL